MKGCVFPQRPISGPLPEQTDSGKPLGFVVGPGA